MKFKEIVDSIGKDVLTEETKKSILESFESSVNEKVTERVKLEVDEALRQLDESHSTKLQGLIEAIDGDHTNKLKKLLEKMDLDYGKKMQEVIAKYETMLETEAINFREQIVNEVSNYIELYLDKTIPVKQISEACENTQSKKMIEEIKKIVAIDEGFITDNIREALTDGKAQMDILRKELNEAVKDNIKTKQELKKSSAELVLEKAILDLPDKKKAFVKRVLKDKDAEYIKENFSFVVEMFERDEKEQTEVITEQAVEETISRTVDTPKSQDNDEVISEQTENKPVNGYLTELKRLDR